LFLELLSKMTQKFFFYMDEEVLVEEKRCLSSALFEKKNDVYYLLNGKVNVTELRGLKIKNHPWEKLSQDLVKRCSEGVILNIDAREFKCPRDRVISLRSLDGVLYDANKKKYEYQESLSDGIFDFLIENGVFKMIRQRYDKLCPDTSSAVEIIRSEMITLGDLMGLMLIGRTSQTFNNESYNILFSSSFSEIVAHRRNQLIIVYSNRDRSDEFIVNLKPIIDKSQMNLESIMVQRSNLSMYYNSGRFLSRYKSNKTAVFYYGDMLFLNRPFANSRKCFFSKIWCVLPEYQSVMIPDGGVGILAYYIDVKRTINNRIFRETMMRVFNNFDLDPGGDDYEYRELKSIFDASNIRRDN